MFWYLIYIFQPFPKQSAGSITLIFFLLIFFSCFTEVQGFDFNTFDVGFIAATIFYCGLAIAAAGGVYYLYKKGWFTIERTRVRNQEVYLFNLKYFDICLFKCFLLKFIMVIWVEFWYVTQALGRDLCIFCWFNKKSKFFLM